MRNSFVWLSKYKKDSSGQATAGPEVIPGKGGPHVEHGKGDKHRQCDDLLQDLQLCQVKLAITDAIGRHLEQVLEKSDPPGNCYGNQPVSGSQIFKMCVPGKGHKDIGNNQQDYCSHEMVSADHFGLRKHHNRQTES